MLDLDLQMPGRGWKHLQLAGIGFVDAYRGEFRTWKYLQFASIGAADAWSGAEASAICWIWICRCLSWGWKHPQFADIGLVDAYHQVDIKNPTTIAEGLFFMSKKSKMFSWTCGAYCAKI